MHLVTTLPLRASLLLVLGAVALIAVACGGGDEAPDEPATPAEAATAAATETPTEPPTETSATEPATDAAQEGGSVDEQYLRAICVGGDDLQAAMFTATIELEAEGGDPDDPEAFDELFVEPLTGFLEHMRQATPPDDLAGYHAAALAQYEAIITIFASMEEGEGREGDPIELLGQMLTGADVVIPEIPEATFARLAQVADGVPECAGSLFLVEFLGSGEAEPIDTGSPAPVDPADEQYVREVCLAGQAYDATFQQAIADLGPDAEFDESDPEMFATAFLEALRGLAADMREISLPDGVADYHTAAVERFDEMVATLDGVMEALDAGSEVADEQLARFQTLLQGGIGLPGLPLSEVNRLAQAANEVIECYGSGFLLGFLGGAP